MPVPLVHFVRSRILADERRALELRRELLDVIGAHRTAGDVGGDDAGPGGGPGVVARHSLDLVDAHLGVLNSMVLLTDLHNGCRSGRPCRVDSGEELGPLAWAYLGNDQACATLQEMARRYYDDPDFDEQWLPQPPTPEENPIVPIPLARVRR